MKEFIYIFLLTWELVESIVNNVRVHNILSQIIAIFFSVKLLNNVDVHNILSQIIAFFVNL